jgi:hypothetical protein
MNLTQSTAFPKTQSRVRGQHVALAGAIAVAVALVIGLAGWPDAGGGHQRPSVPQVESYAPLAPTQARMVLYIVGSEAEAASITEASREAVNLPEVEQAVLVMMVPHGDQASEFQLATMLAEQGAGALAETLIMDLR